MHWKSATPEAVEDRYQLFILFLTEKKPTSTRFRNKRSLQRFGATFLDGCQLALREAN
jgi:hypothetical protein